MTDALRVTGLTKVYRDGTRALDDLGLVIPQGQFFGLLGPNGAGKTTLIGAVSGLVRVAPGLAFVFGRDVAADPEARLLVGVAPQEIHLDRFLSTRDVLVYHGRYFGMRRRYLRRLQAEEGVTVLLTTHYIEEAEALCERVAFIRAGRLLADGEPRRLVARAGAAGLAEVYAEVMAR